MTDTDGIDAVVYVLSPRAISLLGRGELDIEPRLRAVLMLADGRTPVAQFEPFLNSLSPLAPKFIALEERGLLLRMGSVSADAVRAFRERVQAGGPVSSLPPIDASSPTSGFTPLP